MTCLWPPCVRARVFKLFADYSEMVTTEHLQDRLKDKNAKKKGKLLIAALKPAALRQSVETFCVEVMGSVPLSDTDALFPIIMEKAIVFDMVHAYKKLDVRDQTIPADFFASQTSLEDDPVTVNNVHRQQSQRSDRLLVWLSKIRGGELLRRNVRRCEGEFLKEVVYTALGPTG